MNRREFLKLSAVFGASALVPWRRMSETPDIPKHLVEVPRVEMDVIEEDLTRILLWLDDQPVRGIYNATLTASSSMSSLLRPLEWGGDVSTIFCPDYPEIELHCSWAGYKLGEIEHIIDLAQPVEVRVGFGDALRVHQGRAYLAKSEARSPAYREMSRFKQKTIEAMHKLIFCEYWFQGIGQWTIEYEGRRM